MSIVNCGSDGRGNGVEVTPAVVTRKSYNKSLEISSWKYDLKYTNAVLTAKKFHPFQPRKKIIKTITIDKNKTNTERVQISHSTPPVHQATASPLLAITHTRSGHD